MTTEGITLIVGGAGFVGSSLVYELKKSDPTRKIRVLGRSRAPIYQLPHDVEYLQGDASIKIDVINALKGVCKVVDLAYSTVPKTSFEDPLYDVTSNIPTSVNLLQIASQQNLESYLLVSSGGTVYGQSDTLTINETHPTNPISPYGISKLLSEKYGLFFRKITSLPIVIARPSNPYGMNQIGGIDQGFIGVSIGAIKNKKPITVFGEKGTIRDYIYIDDLAKGLRLCLDNGKHGETYNIGTGVGSSNIRILDLIKSSIKVNDLEVNFAGERPFDVMRNVLDSTKAKRELGWVYETNLGKGIEKLCKII